MYHNTSRALRKRKRGLEKPTEKVMERALVLLNETVLIHEFPVKILLKFVNRIIVSSYHGIIVLYHQDVSRMRTIKDLYALQRKRVFIVDSTTLTNFRNRSTAG